MVTGSQGRLIERGAELEAIQLARRQVATGEGALVVVEGAPGVGKSRLLARSEEIAQAEGWLVLRARGTELETDAPFAVVRQLFERVVHGMDDERPRELRTGAPRLALELLDPTRIEPLRAEPKLGLLHGLYWLVAELAAAEPLALVVDDAHWSDAVSLRALGYVARRLEGVAAMVVIAVRSGASEAGSDLAGLLATREAHHLLPAPFSVEGTRAVVSELSGGKVDRSVGDAIHAAAGGNPFLVAELARAVVGSGEMSADAIKQVSVTAPESVVRSLMMRLGSLPAAAMSVARAVAILGDDSPPRRVSRFAGLTLPETLDAVQSLVPAGVLADAERLSFAHPLIRGAVYGDLPIAR